MENLNPLDDEWTSLLTRARVRGRDANKHANEDTFKTNDSIGSLWKVRVKVGHEQATVLTLFDKYLRGGTVFGNIRSIIGRQTCPGWIFVEAPLGSDVQKLCADVSDLYVRTLSLVPSEDALPSITPPPSLPPRRDSFVRITKSKSRLYLDDIAYLYQWDPQRGADVCLVPRLKLDHRRPSRSYRPPPMLVSLEDIERVFPTEPIETMPLEELNKAFRDVDQTDLDHSFKFRGKIYTGGYLRMWTHFVEPILPTASQLATFARCPGILASAVQAASTELEVLCLNIGDRVKVITGQLYGSVGLIIMLEDSTGMASVRIQDITDAVTIPRIYLRKELRIGDAVQVVDGVHAGTVAWVTKIEDNHLTLLDEGKGAFNELHTLKSSVIFHSYSQYLTPPDDRSSPICLPSRQVQDPLHFLKGHEITVVGQSHFKGYEGRVKDTLHDGSFLIGLEAGVNKNVIVHPSNISNRGPTLQPLTTSQELFSSRPLTQSLPLPAGTSVASTSAWHHPHSTKTTSNSIRPIVPSTPVAPNTSTPDLTISSPAWDPSSRTPDPSSDTPYNSWMSHERLKNTFRFKLKRTTQTTLGPLQGLWQAGNFARPGVLRVQFGTKIEEVLERSVTPVRPTQKGVRAVVTDPGHPFFCHDFYVVNILNNQCRVRPWHKSKDAENADQFFNINMDLLAVVAS
ncbi:hypothetical protein H0H93_002702 [Arthromyces matolae]|nr:hypothetical protein H0H93_002702 [Arthromyces matolae]